MYGTLQRAVELMLPKASMEVTFLRMYWLQRRHLPVGGDDNLRHQPRWQAFVALARRMLVSSAIIAAIFQLQ